MKPLSTSIYTFSNLVEGGFLYVDKTKQIEELVRPAAAQYFLSRPRRFDKSLLISTLKAIFSGRKDLFAGLYLASSDYDWQRHPVIHLDMGTGASQNAEELNENLMLRIQNCARVAGIQLDAAKAYQAFEQLASRLAERDGKVVILIDEYDKPLLGYTQAELESNFPEYIDAQAAEGSQTSEEILIQLRDWYNGYGREAYIRPFRFKARHLGWLRRAADYPLGHAG